MGKKGKKSRFNQIVDIDIQYSSNSVGDGMAEHLSELNLTKEKVDELQRIKAMLPSAPQAVRLEEEVAKIPEHGPFRLVLVNVSFNATMAQIEEFLLPVKPTNIRKAENEGHFRGYCFIDFANRSDLAMALEKNGSIFLTRRVNMRIADPQNDRGDRGGGGGYDRDIGFNRRRTGGYDGVSYAAAPPDGWHRQARPVGPPLSSEGPHRDAKRWIPPSIRSGEPMAPAPPADPLARPIIKLAPRTKPADDNSMVVSERQRSIFGDAKPVDIVYKESEERVRAKPSQVTTARQRKIFGDAKPVDIPVTQPQVKEPVPVPQKAPVKKEEPEAITETAPKAAPNPAPAGPKYNAWSKPLV